MKATSFGELSTLGAQITEKQAQLIKCQTFQPRSEEQCKRLALKSRYLTAALCASIKGAPPILSTSGIIQYVQIAPHFGEAHGFLADGSEVHRLADVRIRVKDESPIPEHFDRIGFTVQMRSSHFPPSWLDSYRPFSVNADYAARTGMWTPLQLSNIRSSARAEADYNKRQGIYAAMWEPYTDVVDHIMSAALGLIKSNLSKVLFMTMLARTVEEEEKYLTPVQGFSDAQKVYDEEVVPYLISLVENLDKKLNDVSVPDAPVDDEGAYGTLQE